MKPSDVLSMSANLVSASASLIDAHNTINQPTAAPAPAKPKPSSSFTSPQTTKNAFVELNGTLLDLNQVILIRKAKNNTNCFVMFMQNGLREETADYRSSLELDKDFAKINAMLKTKSPFIELNGTMVDMRTVKLIRKAKASDNHFIIIFHNGSSEATAEYSSNDEYMDDYVLIRAALSNIK